MDPVHEALVEDSEAHASAVGWGLARFVADASEQLDEASRSKYATIRRIDGNRLGDRRVEVSVYEYDGDRFGVVGDSAADTGGWSFPPGRYDRVVDLVGGLDDFVIVEEED